MTKPHVTAKANRAGKCLFCDQAIAVGAPIALSEECGVWVHLACWTWDHDCDCDGDIYENEYETRWEDEYGYGE